MRHFWGKLKRSPTLYPIFTVIKCFRNRVHGTLGHSRNTYSEWNIFLYLYLYTVQRMPRYNTAHIWNNLVPISIKDFPEVSFITAYKNHSIQEYSEGPSTYDVRKILGFFDPLPPLVRIWDWSTVLNSRNLPYYIFFWANPPSPLSADIIYGCPLRGFPYMTSEKFSDFFTPFFPCPHVGLSGWIYSAPATTSDKEKREKERGGIHIRRPHWGGRGVAQKKT